MNKKKTDFTDLRWFLILANKGQATIKDLETLNKKLETELYGVIYTDNQRCIMRPFANATKKKELLNIELSKEYTVFNLTHERYIDVVAKGFFRPNAQENLYSFEIGGKEKENSNK